MFSTPKFSTKQKENYLINGFVTSHDYLCDCEKPAFHCLNILAKTLGPQLQQQDKQQIIKCLGTTEENAVTTQDADAIGIGDLEKLFTDDFTEDDDG